jgi:3-methylcrotonyl-CoA carboxylase beta subunit
VISTVTTHLDGPTIRTNLDRTSTTFQTNETHHRGLAADLQAQLASTALGGPERSRQRHVARGELLQRDRVEALLDPGTPFLELSPMAAHGMYENEAPAAGIITGVGQASGTTCVVVANDATVKGGTYFPITVKKHLRTQEVASDNHLPCVYLVDGTSGCPTRRRCR